MHFATKTILFTLRKQQAKKKSEGERVRSPRTFRGSESLSIQQLEVYRTTMVERWG